MNPALAPFVLIALVSAMSGSLVAAGQGAVSLALCGGSAVTVPAGPPEIPGSANTPCCAKGCQSGSSRKRLDRAQ